MVAKIGFWTPVKNEAPVSCSQKLSGVADSYPFLGGKRVVVIPGVVEKGSYGVRVEEKQPALWKNAAKAISIFTVVVPFSMIAVKSISRISHSYHIHEVKAPVSESVLKEEPGPLTGMSSPNFDTSETSSLGGDLIPESNSSFPPLVNSDRQGDLSFRNLSKDAFMEILQLEQVRKTPVDPNIGETLFSKWAGTGDAKLTADFLTIDPKAIKQSEGREVSFFEKAVLAGHEEEAKVLLKAMNQQQVKFSETDRWIRKAFLNDCYYDHNDFQKLSQELRDKMMNVAKLYGHKESIEKLSRLALIES